MAFSCPEGRSKDSPLLASSFISIFKFGRVEPHERAVSHSSEAGGIQRGPPLPWAFSPEEARPHPVPSFICVIQAVGAGGLSHWSVFSLGSSGLRAARWPGS